jgi:sec-independent protein translocase protein TatA
VQRYNDQGGAKDVGAGRTLMDGILQPTHLFFILLIVLIIFGPGKLPELGRGLGKGIREFKGALKDATEEPKDAGNKS